MIMESFSAYVCVCVCVCECVSVWVWVSERERERERERDLISALIAYLLLFLIFKLQLFPKLIVVLFHK